jgi:hypothetical protein
MWDSLQVGYVIKPGRPDCIKRPLNSLADTLVDTLAASCGAVIALRDSGLGS